MTQKGADAGRTKKSKGKGNLFPTSSFNQYFPENTIDAIIMTGLNNANIDI